MPLAALRQAVHNDECAICAIADATFNFTLHQRTEKLMKVPAIKYRVIDNTAGDICCVIAVKKSEMAGFSPLAIAEKFADGIEHANHKDAIVQVWEEDEFNFSTGEEVRLVQYPK
jgi:hypothetical protein